MNVVQFMDGMQSVAATTAPMAVSALWQGIVIALGLGACLRVAPRASANLRFVLWSAGFAVLVALPFFPGHGFAHEGAVQGMAVASEAAKPWLQVDLRWSLAIAGVWMVMSLVRAADLAVHSWRLRRLWKTAVPVEMRAGMVLPAGIRSRRDLQICTTRELERPSVIGFFAPRILIPEWLYARLTDAELNQIVLHEAQHLSRCDDWTNLLQKLCLVLFPLNPALWWMEHQLCKEREMACDEGVIAITHAPRAYAACLTSIAERGLAHRAEALSLGAWQHRSELVRRVHGILRRGGAMSPFASGVLLATLGGSLLAASVELARCPQFVAFVPVQKTMLAAGRGKDSGDVPDAVYRPEARGLSGFHAVEAKAVMPKATTPAERRQSAGVHSMKVAAAEVPVREVRAKATLQASTAPEEQQWIVLTSWEQIETSSTPAVRAPALHPVDALQGDVAENANSADSLPQAGAPDIQAPETRMTRRVMVTQLVLRVVPVSLKSSQSSQSSRPKAEQSFRAGWLVFQL